MVLGCNGDVASVEKRVQVAPKQESVVDAMLAALSEGAYMCSHENGERPASSYRALTIVGICDQYAK
jgi:hypothetical protein